MRLDWQKLHALALAEVKATLAALPEPLRDRAQALPVTVALALGGVAAVFTAVLVWRARRPEGEALRVHASRLLIVLFGLLAV